MSFSDLALVSPLLKAIAQCGYDAPTPIQARAIPEILAGKDLIASAQTGTGKTAAFMLPALQRMSSRVRGLKGAPRVLVLTPTRELASQVTDATRNYGRHLHIRSTVILGGMPYRNQFRDLARPVDLVVATPGRLLDHLGRGSINLSRLELLILDEADRMLDMGFKDAVQKVCEATPKHRQTLLFAATWNNNLAGLANTLLRDPVRVEVAGKQTTHETIEQRLHVADNLHHKHRMLERLVSDEALTRAIIFVATKRDADRLARELARPGRKVDALHGDMSQGARNRAMERLRRGRAQLLVATDVASRGIDVPGISHVINFDLPNFAEDYVHRIGRTGRAGAEGTAISFASAADYGALQRIQRFIGQQLPVHVLPGLEPTRPFRQQAGRSPRRPATLGKGRKPFLARKKAGAGGRYKGKTGAPNQKPGARAVEYRTGRSNGKRAQSR